MQRAKALIRGLLTRAGLNERFRDSRLYAAYLRLFLPEFADRKRRELNVYRSLITRPGPIFDIGANIGQKAVLFAQIGSPVICVEPDTTAVDTLRRRFKANDRVHILHAAVGSAIGTARMYQLDESSPYNTLSEKWMRMLTDTERPRFATPPTVRAVLEVPATTLDRLIERFGMPAYVKIDVEGAELNAIKGLSARVPLISFESVLPDFREEALEILERLHAMDPRGMFNYCLDQPGPELSSERWLSYDEIRDFVRSGEGLLMEIYCRSNPD
jgi:FkbM family methyltransferase